MSKLTKHIFICENRRDPQSGRPSCGQHDSSELRQKMKQILKEKKLHKQFRANSAGCLDVCQHGPAMVIYPEGIWYGGVCPGDIEEIVDKSILGQQVIERLLIDKSS